MRLLVVPNLARRVANNFIGLLAVRGLSSLVPLMVMPHLIKVLGMEGWGTVSFALAIASFVGPIVLYGFPISATAAIARIDDRAVRQELVAEFGAGSFWLAILSLILVCGGAWLLSALFSVATTPQMILLASAGAALTALVPTWFFVGVGDTKPLVFSQAVSRLGYVLLIFLFIRTPGQEDAVMILVFVSALLGFLTSWVTLAKVHRYFPSLMVRPRQIVEILKEGLPTFLLMFVPTLYNAGGVFLLGVTFGVREVGQFAIAVTLVEVALTIGRLLANALLPVMATEKNSNVLARKILIWLGLLLSGLICFAANILAQWLADDVESVRKLIWILAASIPFAFIQLAYNHNHLAIIGHERLASRVVIVMSIIAAIIGALVIPAYGSIGAALTILVGRVLLGCSSFVAAWWVSDDRIGGRVV